MLFFSFFFPSFFTFYDIECFIFIFLFLFIFIFLFFLFFIFYFLFFSQFDAIVLQMLRTLIGILYFILLSKASKENRSNFIMV